MILFGDTVIRRRLPVIPVLMLCMCMLCICIFLSSCTGAGSEGISSGPITEEIPEEEMMQFLQSENSTVIAGNTEETAAETAGETAAEPESQELTPAADPAGTGAEGSETEAEPSDEPEEETPAEDAGDMEDPQEEQPVSVPVFSAAHDYYYQFLNAGEAAAYDTMLEACKALKQKADFSVPITEEGLYNALDALRYDHPEYYWVRNSSRAYGYETGEIIGIEFAVPADAVSVLQRMEAAADSILSQTAGMPERERIRSVYSWIIASTAYGSTDGNREQTAVGVLLDHRAVCAGYADAFKLLCSRAGIACTTLVGTALNEDGSPRGDHAWNQVRIGGGYYWVDTTFGDPQSGSDMHWDPAWISYDHFCTADDPFLKNHIVDRTLGRKDTAGHFTASYAACTDSSLDEYVMTGRCFGSLQDAVRFISACLASGDPFFAFRMTSDAEYMQTYSYLFQNGGMQQILDGLTVPYTEYQCFSDSMQRTIGLEFR